MNFLPIFFEELGAIVKKIITTNPSCFLKIDRFFHKFSTNFIQKCLDTFSSNVIPIFTELYAEDIYYCGLYIICLSNNTIELSRINFDDFYNFKFYENERLNLFLVEFKKGLIKYICTNMSSLNIFRTPEKCQIFQNYLSQMTIMLFTKFLNDNNELNTIPQTELLKTYEILLESISTIYIESHELIYSSISEKNIKSTQFLDNNLSRECEWDIRLEVICLLMSLCSKIEKWKLFDRLAKILTEMTLNDHIFDQNKTKDRILIGKVAALQTIISCALKLVNTCCKKSCAWKDIFSCCLYIVKLKSVYFDESDKLSESKSDYEDSEGFEAEEDVSVEQDGYQFAEYELEDYYLSHGNTLEALDSLYSSVNEITSTLIRKQTLDDIKFVLSFLYTCAVDETTFIHNDSKISYYAQNSIAYLFN
ncbi:hypothetical protein MXB_5430, partial [Myxobolus squamalis]